MKDYYNVKDIISITGASQSWCYELIRILRTKFERKYPDSITPQGKIPIWFFEEVMKNKRVGEEDERRIDWDIWRITY